MATLTIHSNISAQLTGASHRTYTLLHAALAIPVEGARHSPAFQRGFWDGKIHLDTYDKEAGTLTFPRGMSHRVIELLNELGEPHELEDIRQNKLPRPDRSVVTSDMLPGYTIRPYQRKAIKASLKAQTGIINIATGGGKTLIAAAITKAIGRRTLFLVHKKILLTQARERFAELLGTIEEHIGVIGGGQFKPKEVTIGMVQTLQGKCTPAKKRLFDAYLKTVDVVFLDEGHHVQAKTFSALMTRIPAQFRYLLSGTPFSGAAGDLVVEAATGPLICKIDNQQLIDLGVNAKPTIHIVPMSEPDISPTEAWQQVYKAGIVFNVARNKRIVEYAQRYALASRRTLILISQIWHGQALSQMLNELNVDNEFVHGKMPSSAVDSAKAAFTEGRFPVLIASSIFNEGADCLTPDTEVLTRRGWRTAETLGASDEVLTLDMVTEQGVWSPIERKIKRAIRPGERLVAHRTQHMDVLVTENHDFITSRVHYVMKGGVSHKVSDPWRKEAAHVLVGRTSGVTAIPTSVVVKKTRGIKLTADEIRVLAWLYTDGSVYSQGAEIRQIKTSPFVAEIDTLLRRTAIPFKRTTRKTGLVTFYIKPADLRRIAPYWSQGFCPKLYDMNREQFLAFWTEAINADGSSGVKWRKFGEKKAPELCNTNEALIDAMQALAVQHGFSARKSTARTRIGTPVFYLGLREQSRIETIYAASRNNAGKRFAFVPAENTPYVWCITTATGTIMTRRNGRVAVIGNCPSINSLIIADGGKSIRKVLQQIGRGLRRKEHDNTLEVVDFADKTHTWLVKHSAERLAIYRAEGFNVIVDK